MRAPGTAFTCDIGVFGRFFVLRWNSAPDVPSVRHARAALERAATAANRAPLALLLVLASTSRIPDGGARAELKLLTEEAKKVASHGFCVIEVTGVLATMLRTISEGLGTITRLSSTLLRFESSSERALRKLGLEIKENPDAALEGARRMGLIR